MTHRSPNIETESSISYSIMSPRNAKSWTASSMMKTQKGTPSYYYKSPAALTNRNHSYSTIHGRHSNPPIQWKTAHPAPQYTLTITKSPPHQSNKSPSPTLTFLQSPSPHNRPSSNPY